MLALSIRRTSPLLPLLVILALTSGAASSVQATIGWASVQAATNDSDIA